MNKVIALCDFMLSAFFLYLLLLSALTVIYPSPTVEHEDKLEILLSSNRR